MASVQPLYYDVNVPDIAGSFIKGKQQATNEAMQEQQMAQMQHNQELQDKQFAAEQEQQAKQNKMADTENFMKFNYNPRKESIKQEYSTGKITLDQANQRLRTLSEESYNTMPFLKDVLGEGMFETVTPEGISTVNKYFSPEEAKNNGLDPKKRWYTTQKIFNGKPIGNMDVKEESLTTEQIATQALEREKLEVSKMKAINVNQVNPTLYNQRVINYTQMLADSAQAPQVAVLSDGSQQVVNPKSQSSIPAGATARGEVNQGYQQKTELRKVRRTPLYINATDGLNSLHKAMNMMEKNPTIFRDVFQKKLKTGEAGKFSTEIDNAVDVVTRIRTGAALNEEEQKFYSENFAPGWYNDQKNAQYKLQRLSELYENVIDRLENPNISTPTKANPGTGGASNYNQAPAKPSRSTVTANLKSKGYTDVQISAYLTQKGL